MDRPNCLSGSQSCCDLPISESQGADTHQRFRFGRNGVPGSVPDGIGRYCRNEVGDDGGERQLLGRESDGTTFTSDGGTTARGRLDHGSNYYAAQTFSDAPGGRRLLLAWVPDGFSRTGIWTQVPWQSGYTVVRELSLKMVWIAWRQ